MLKRNMFTIALVALFSILASAGTYAQGTPDGETPANEGICDDLMFATPGLYGLCIAFCESQDCEPDFNLDDPFENCSPSSEVLLRNYNQKKQPGDPEMPCVATECPCWTEDELNALRFPGPNDLTFCFKDRNSTLISNRDEWRTIYADFQGVTVVATIKKTVSLNDPPVTSLIFSATLGESIAFLPPSSTL